MYELIKLTENDYFIQCPAKIGLVRLNSEEVCLIDSGNDKDAGKKALQIITSNGWTLSAIYNTHSHADHIGGNKFLQSKTNCRIFARGAEVDFTRHPILEPSLLYGGYPHKELKHKFLLAAESNAEEIDTTALPSGMTTVPLQGHSIDMIGFRTADDTVYLADCLSSKQTLDKYGIGYIYDVGEYLETLQRVRNMQARIFVPSHTEPTENIAPLAEYNIAKVNEISEKILSICASPTSFEDILSKLFDCYSMTMTVQQYALVGSTVRSYIAYLGNAELLNVHILNNTMLWQRA
ncbi:MAG: MBL fold metallo-hydrolase [Clostridia bacterium]|nr:MBL fold metallo-hydrolase [Clostridia bacterium]